MRKLELLAPARDAEIGRIALLAGADAVYIGAPDFGARAAATNTIESISELVEFAHRYRARVYVTLNTILLDNELERAEKLVWQLYAVGVDALIVQDMAYLEMKLPPIALHASTQCDIRSPEKALRLAQSGFSQLVLPREFSLDEIRACSIAGVPLEVFVHGALCVSYSGDCQAGYVAMGRSANRGVCPQMCRLPYLLIDDKGKVVGEERHYLSLCDMNRWANLEELIEAGASSFKIEGRLKDARYVANVVASYSQRLNEIVSNSGGMYARSSAGTTVCGFTPDLKRTFNRGYTSYFINGTKNAVNMASLDTPKWAGVPVGKVTRIYKSGHSFEAQLNISLSNGDGLGFFNSKRVFVGFRLNRINGKTLYPAVAQGQLKIGDILYRNSDKAFFDILDKADASCRRTIRVDFTLSDIDSERFAITAKDERNCSATVVVDSPYSLAKTEQTETRRRALCRLGDTIYAAGEIYDELGNRFVAASVLTAARRSVLEMLDTDADAMYTTEKRAVKTLANDAFMSLPPMTYHDNVANLLARNFYISHGALIQQAALEAGNNSKFGEITVMTTKYCLRRELGACLKDKDRRNLPSPLYLQNNTGRYRLDFDCSRCGMCVVRIK